MPLTTWKWSTNSQSKHSFYKLCAEMREAIKLRVSSFCTVLLVVFLFVMVWEYKGAWWSRTPIHTQTDCFSCTKLLKIIRYFILWMFWEDGRNVLQEVLESPLSFLCLRRKQLVFVKDVVRVTSFFSVLKKKNNWFCKGRGYWVYSK